MTSAAHAARAGAPVPFAVPARWAAPSVQVDWWHWGTTLLVLGVCVIVAAVLLRRLGVERIWAPAAAIGRAFVQLALLGLILQGIVTDLRWTFAWLAVMLSVAVWTSGRRIGVHGRQWAHVAVGIVAGTLASMVVVFGLGALDASAQNVLAFGGMITGNTMTICTLAGRGFLSGVRDGWAEVEAWLSLGARPRQSTRRFATAAAASALLPTVDVTKTTGLVMLPGAFVGALFGGSTPIEAGRFQLVVLAGIMLAGTIAVTLLLAGLASVSRFPETGERR